MVTRTRRPLSLLLAGLLALSLVAVMPGLAGAQEGSGEVSFAESPGNVRAGRTVPVQFTVTDAVDPISATAVDPDGDETELDLRERPGGRFHTVVHTDADVPGAID